MTWFTRLPVQSRGILYMICSVTVFSAMDMLAKMLGQYVDLSQVLWARYGGQLAILLVIFAPRLRSALTTQHPWLQLMRGLMQLAAAACFFKALQTLGLAEATAVADLAPILITLGAAFLLKERVGPRRIAGITVAMIGALIVIRPGTNVFQPASLWPLGSAACLAGYALATRHIGVKESPATGLLYSGLICTAILSLIVPFRWVTPEPIALIIMLGIGAVGTVGQMLMIRAYREADASAIAPFSYAGLLAASGWGFLVFGTVPDAATILGALVIVAAGLYVWHRERQTGQRTSLPPEEMGQP